MYNAYESSSNDRPEFRNFYPAQSDADGTIDELDTLSDGGWHFYNNTGVGRGTVETAVNSAVPTGLKCHPVIDRKALGITAEEAKAWQKKTKDSFNTWAESKEADYYRSSNFAQLQQQALTTMLVSGDALAIFTDLEREGVPYRLALKMVEGVQLQNEHNAPDTERLAGGIEYGTDGIGAYHFLQHHPKGINHLKQGWTIIPAYSGIRQNVAHLMDRKRVAQRRGVSIFAPIASSLLQLKRMTSAELASVITTSMLVAFIKTTKEFQNTDVDGDPLNDEADYDATTNEYKLGNGTIIRLDENEEMQMFDPKKKNETFVPFVNAVKTEICSATQIPPEVLDKRFDSSYSASMGALLEMWKWIKRLRHTIVSDLCQPTYSTWLLEEVIAGRIEAPGFLDDYFMRKAWSGSMWIGDPQGKLNPDKEVRAAVLAVENKLSTLEQETFKLNGGDFDTNAERLLVEAEMLAPLAGQMDALDENTQKKDVIDEN